MLRAILSFLIGFALATAMLVVRGHAHDHDHPERNAWMMALENAAGDFCCGPNDYNAVKDVQWDVWRDYEGFSHYKVFVENDWLKVDDSKVVHEPNKYGVPIVWLYHANGIPEVKCFLPGSGL
jgi:hypothetical protein